MSLIVAVCGLLTVFEIAPEMNGCAAVIMSAGVGDRPLADRDIGDREVLVLRPGAPTIVFFSAMWALIWSTSASE